MGLSELTQAVQVVHERKLVMLGSLKHDAFGLLHGKWVLHDLQVLTYADVC